MLVKCFIYIIVSSAGSLLICLFGTLIVYLFQDQETAKKLFYSYVFKFNGVFVAGVGYGLLFFVREKSRTIFNLLNIILDLHADDEMRIKKYQEYMTFTWGNIISIPITIVGGIILWNCGYPLNGFAKIFLAMTSISLYYIGGSMLAYFIFSSKIFLYFEENENRIRFNSNVSPLHIETFNTYFTVISTIGIIALYLAFRGTLTANFVNATEGTLLRTILIFPIVIFSSAPMLYSFYPRYILKRIYDNNFISRIAELEQGTNTDLTGNRSIKERLEMEKLMIDIKESLTLERNKMTILNIKDLPSILLLIVMLIQFIISHDNIISVFLKSFFN